MSPATDISRNDNDIAPTPSTVPATASCSRCGLMGPAAASGPVAASEPAAASGAAVS